MKQVRDIVWIPEDLSRLPFGVKTEIEVQPERLGGKSFQRQSYLTTRGKPTAGLLQPQPCHAPPPAPVASATGCGQMPALRLSFSR